MIIFQGECIQESMGSILIQYAFFRSQRHTHLRIQNLQTTDTTINAKTVNKLLLCILGTEMDL